jgi:8-oxo-dGTP pyrophosphatase MutT (NUDIX family)
MWERPDAELRIHGFREGLDVLKGRARFEFPAVDWPAESRAAAVLIPFWEFEGELFTVLTRRSASLSRHAGQVSFPGGLREPGEDWITTALRESNEEVGLDRELVEVMGFLDDAFSGTGNHLVGVVAWLRDAPKLCANPEVAEILHVPVREILRTESWRVEPVVSRGVHFENDIVEWSGGSAFGLSADLLQEALRWGLGESPARGPRRLSELRALTTAIAAERRTEQKGSETR